VGGRFKSLVARSHNGVRGSNSAYNASTKVTFCNGCHPTHPPNNGFRNSLVPHTDEMSVLTTLKTESQDQVTAPY